MRSNKGRGGYVPKRNKAVGDYLLGSVVNSYKGYQGTCRFVINENGKLCKGPTDRRHVISNSSVLDRLKDQKSGKVMELWWGPEHWKDFLMRSSPENPLDFSDPSAFEPRPVGTGSACTGSFACLSHDQEFIKWIDCDPLDINNPKVAFLLGYRAVLYETDLGLQGKHFQRAWNAMAMRHPDRKQRIDWLKSRRELDSKSTQASQLAARLGKIWFSNKESTAFAPVVASTTIQLFRSRLEFAASKVIGADGVLVVLPQRDALHKIIMLSWNKNSEVMDLIRRQLCEISARTMTQDDYGVSLMLTLMKGGTGIAALSPGSYNELDDEDRRQINELLKDNADVSRVGQVLGIA